MKKWTAPAFMKTFVKMAFMGFALASFAQAGSGADAGPTAAPEGARVYFIAPLDGETLAGPVTVRFGLKGMGIAPAGIAFDGSGHHHLLIDTDLPPLNAPIPTDEHHVHFGKGQTETSLQLPPGRHTLQLLLGDHRHIPHHPPIYSEKITITVK